MHVWQFYQEKMNKRKKKRIIIHLLSYVKKKSLKQLILDMGFISLQIKVT